TARRRSFRTASDRVLSDGRNARNARWTPPTAFGNTFSWRDGPGAAVARNGRGVRGPSAGRDLELGSRFAAEPAPPRTATLNRPYHAPPKGCKHVMVIFRWAEWPGPVREAS